jgi:hypothetical protein
MRRWQAIPVAALVALAVGAIMFTRTPTSVQAGTTTPFEFYMDCGSGPGANCTFPSSETTVDVAITIKNNSGGDVTLATFDLGIKDDNQPVIAPTAPACPPPGWDCNPDFNQSLDGGVGFFSCSPAPVADADASGTLANSSIHCATGTPAQTLVDGGSLLLATVHYTVGGDGVANVTFDNTFSANGAYATDNAFAELGSCAPIVSIEANCFGVTVQVGASAATNTPIPTATDTPVPATATATCVGAACPTATSEAFVTVTPTPGGETATPAPGTTAPAGGETPAAPGGEQPGAAPGGEQPGGGTGAGGSRPIRLPDTGTSPTDDTGSLWLGLLATVGAGALAGGLYFGVAVAADRRRGGK